MIEVIGNLVGGNIFGAVTSMFKESPQENIREAAFDILRGEKVEANMEKLARELQRPGGDRAKLEEVGGLMAQMSSGEADLTSTMEQILGIVGPKDAQKMGIPAGGSRGQANIVQF